MTDVLTQALAELIGRRESAKERHRLILGADPRRGELERRLAAASAHLQNGVSASEAAQLGNELAGLRSALAGLPRPDAATVESSRRAVASAVAELGKATRRHHDKLAEPVWQRMRASIEGLFAALDDVAELRHRLETETGYHWMSEREDAARLRANELADVLGIPRRRETRSEAANRASVTRAKEAARQRAAAEAATRDPAFVAPEQVLRENRNTIVALGQERDRAVDELNTAKERAGRNPSEDQRSHLVALRGVVEQLDAQIARVREAEKGLNEAVKAKARRERAGAAI